MVAQGIPLLTTESRQRSNASWSQKWETPHFSRQVLVYSFAVGQKTPLKIRTWHLCQDFHAYHDASHPVTLLPVQERTWFFARRGCVPESWCAYTSLTPPWTSHSQFPQRTASDSLCSLQEAHRKLDKDNDGHVTVEEFISVIQDMKRIPIGP